MNKKTQTITLTALFTALTCISTYLLKIPSFVPNGYIHLGDAFVIISGILLGPLYGTFAAGAGSALADAFGGYVMYVPATFIIKALIAATAYFIFYKLTFPIKNNYIKCAISGIFSAIIMVSGYFIYEYILYGNGAFAGIIGNTIQGLSGIVISTLLLPKILKIKNRG